MTPKDLDVSSPRVLAILTTVILDTETSERIPSSSAVLMTERSRQPRLYVEVRLKGTQRSRE